MTARAMLLPIHRFNKYSLMARAPGRSGQGRLCGTVRAYY